MPSEQDPVFKVVDRRRFRADGEPAGPSEAAPGCVPAADEGSEASPGRSRDSGEATIAAQAARIDELARAYAALVEDNKGFRARLEREKERQIASERAAVAQALLETADELERALKAMPRDPARRREGPLATLAEGLELALASLGKRIAELGAERIPVVGQRFDPRTAEAVDSIPVSDPARDEVVVEEARAGYRIGDRLLRPARVRVGRLVHN